MRIRSGKRRPRPGAAAAVAAALAVAALPASGKAQNLALPATGVEASAGTREVTVTWPEVSLDEGRRISNVAFSNWDFAGSSVVQIEGDYRLDCDYRLRITKIPQDPGFNRRTLLVYQIFENTTGTGAPLRIDTLRVIRPDSTHFLNPAIAGNLGLRVSPNVQPAQGPLGTIAVTTGGLNTSLAATTGYFATARNTVSSLSDTLRVQVSGPVNLSSIPNPLPPSTPSTVLTVTSPGQVFSVMDGMTVSFSDGSGAPGDTAKWTARYLFPSSGRITADLEAFEGYHVWRSDLPNVDDFTLLGEIRQCRSKFDFALVNEDEIDDVDVELRYDSVGRTFTVIDRDVHDDFPYRYAVSTFDRGFLGNLQNLTFEGPLATTPKLYPARAARDRAQRAFVVPNPFKRRADFQEGDRKVVFANLPTRCTIRVFTAAADHLVTLEHGPGEPRSTSATSREWDLRTANGVTIAPGIYIFQIEGTNRYERPLDGGGTETVTEDFQQTGKMIVVR